MNSALLRNLGLRLPKGAESQGVPQTLNSPSAILHPVQAARNLVLVGKEDAQFIGSQYQALSGAQSRG